MVGKTILETLFRFPVFIEYVNIVQTEREPQLKLELLLQRRLKIEYVILIVKFIHKHQGVVLMHVNFSNTLPTTRSTIHNFTTQHSVHIYKGPWVQQNLGSAT
jgi:hypothetical protein